MSHRHLQYAADSIRDWLSLCTEIGRRGLQDERNSLRSSNPPLSNRLKVRLSLRVWGFGRADIRRDNPQQPVRVGLGGEVGRAELDSLVAGHLIVLHREHHDG